jgi:hypothetical protein
MSTPVPTIDLALSAAVRDVLNAATRPVPSGVPIRAAMDIEPVERPFLVVISSGGESLHPLVRRVQCVLRVRSQIDGTTAAVAAGYLTACAGALMQRGAALEAALAAAGLRILVWTPGEFGEEQEDERGRFQDLAWNVTLTAAVAAEEEPEPDP